MTEKSAKELKNRRSLLRKIVIVPIAAVAALAGLAIGEDLNRGPLHVGTGPDVAGNAYWYHDLVPGGFYIIRDGSENIAIFKNLTDAGLNHNTPDTPYSPSEVTTLYMPYGGLYTNGYVSGIINAISDITTKTNIKASSGNLARVLRMQPVNYVRKMDQRNCIGLVAQQVQTIAPEAVNSVQDPKLGPLLGINPLVIISMLVGAIQELKTEVEELKKLKDM